MIKGLFILYDFSTRNIDISSGISKKIYAQKEVLESLPCKMEFYNPYEYKMDNKNDSIITKKIVTEQTNIQNDRNERKSTYK